MNSSSVRADGSGYRSSVAILVGAAAAMLLVAFYVALVSLANGPRHAVDLLGGDRYFVAAIALGFGLEAGLYAYVRLLRATAAATRSSGAVAATGTGTSTVAMVACCAHHVVDVLPVVGLSGAAIFLTTYRTPIMLTGLAVNVAGIVVMLSVVRTTRIQLAPRSQLGLGGEA